MSYVNYNQQAQVGVQGQQQMPPQQEYPKVDRKLVTGRITKDPIVNITNSGKPVLNLDFVMDVSSLPTGAQWAKATFWEDDAYFIANFFKKGDIITLSGVVKWSEYQKQDGTTGNNLEYDYASVYFDANQVLNLVRTEIGMALESLNQPPTQPQQQVQENVAPTVAPTVEPTTQNQVLDEETIREEFGAPTLEIHSDEMPF